MSKQKEGATLAQSQRSKIVAKVKQRGKRTASLWLLRCPLTRQNIVVIGDLRAEHFYACEGDPTVLRVDYNPPPINLRLGNGLISTVQFDAMVEFTDGRKECRHVSAVDIMQQRADQIANTAAAQSVGADYQLIGLKDLDRLGQRVQNWRRALAALNRCDKHTLELIESHVVTCMINFKHISLAAILEMISDEPESLVLAAVVRLIRKRILSSDLDDKVWSLHTRIWMEQSK